MIAACRRCGSPVELGEGTIAMMRTWDRVLESRNELWLEPGEVASCGPCYTTDAGKAERESIHDRGLHERMAAEVLSGHAEAKRIDVPKVVARSPWGYFVAWAVKRVEDEAKAKKRGTGSARRTPWSPRHGEDRRAGA